MKFWIILLLIGLLLSSSISAESIYELITKGNLEQAADTLSKLSTASVRNGNILFFHSMLESDAVKAVQLMEASLEASVDIQYREEIYCRLAQFYLLKENYLKLQRIITDYKSLWEKGKYADQMLRFSVLIDQHDKKYESALRQVDRYLLNFTDEERQQCGTIDKARIMNYNSKNIGADRLLETLSRSRSGTGVPQALYLLTLRAIEKQDSDEAVFYYNLFREGYPSAVGFDALVEKLLGLTSNKKSDSEADQLTGTFYSVQVGVFSDNGNAKKQADLFKKQGHKVDITDKTISGVKYKVVYVGRFKSYEKASDLKLQLEAENHEAFQVVAR